MILTKVSTHSASFLLHSRNPSRSFWSSSSEVVFSSHRGLKQEDTHGWQYNIDVIFKAVISSFHYWNRNKAFTNLKYCPLLCLSFKTLCHCTFFMPFSHLFTPLILLFLSFAGALFASFIFSFYTAKFSLLMLLNLLIWPGV